MLKPEEKNILEELHKANKEMTGTCFALAMRNDDGSIEVYRRENQPCYGELRKYKKTHGKEATQPEGKPGDLFDPFPVGTPEALAIGLPHWKYVKDGMAQFMPFFDFLFSNESPFVRGTGGPDNVIWSEQYCGFILLDLNIDPTVLVNMLKHLEGSQSRMRFLEFRNAGLSDIEAFVADYCCNFTKQAMYDPQTRTYVNGLSMVDDYVYPLEADLERLVNLNPVDLTGGTLRDRFDYSRRNLHKIFYKKGGISFSDEIIKLVGKGDLYNGVPISLKDFVSHFKTIYDRELSKLKERKAA